MSAITFRAYGAPAPQGSKRHVGNGRMIESSANLRPWRESVKLAALLARQAHDNITLDGPLGVLMTFTLRKPSSAPKTRRVWPCKRPDLSKLIRATEDAITDSGLWVDDALVISVMAQKVYVDDPDAADTPGVFVSIWPVLP